MVFQSIRQRLPPLLKRSSAQSKGHTASSDNKAANSATTTVQSDNVEAPESTTTYNPPFDVVIAGGGIVGLVLALALHQHGVCQHLHIYEQAPAFHDDVGAGMGLYPNGLRVIRDISPVLLKRLQEAGCPYKYRRWMRHDGTEVAVADESVLARKTNDNVDDDMTDLDIQPIGIRRWKLQKILFEACQDAGIVIHFGKRLDTMSESTDGVVKLHFEDGSVCETKLLLAADGAKSKIRSIVTDGACTLNYTGTTCLMGTSSTLNKNFGMMLPSSPTTKCHGAFYPTGGSEQCFQFHFPTALDNVPNAALNGWGGMTNAVSQEECQELAKKLDEEGWDAERFLQPLRNVEKAMRVGLMTLDPPLQKFTFGRVILVGDAAHPPVPYLGQGAQQGLEDAGTLAWLLKQCCVVKDGEDNRFSLEGIGVVMQIYNELRVPRTNEMAEHSKLAGLQQQKRAENPKYNKSRESLIQREVFYKENSSHLFPGVQYEYKKAVELSLKTFSQRQALAPYPLASVPEEERNVERSDTITTKLKT